MTSLLNFDKPKNLAQWLIFLAAIGISLSSPAGSRVFLRELNKLIAKQFDKFDEKTKIYKPREVAQTIYYLKRRKLIKIKKINGKISFLLTEKGRKRHLEYNLENIKIPKMETWDGRWRLLMFDIPEKYKFGREALRDKLKKLGFLRFQKSVWLYPYPCQNEIDFIAENFSVAQYLILLTVQIEDDQPLRKHFNLS